MFCARTSRRPRPGTMGCLPARKSRSATGKPEAPAFDAVDRGSAQYRRRDRVPPCAAAAPGVVETGRIRSSRPALRGRTAQRPPAWRGHEPGRFPGAFLPVDKPIDIGASPVPDHERTPRVFLLDQTIAHLANQQHQREGFLSAARAAWGLKPYADAADRLVEVTDFGSNPGALRMLQYVPPALSAAPALVVVLHGCAQTAAGYDHASGWSALASTAGASSSPACRPGVP